MKDHDFDEIGKRLYDLQADPPANGWERIRGGIVPPKPGGNVFRGEKSLLWKALIVAIPLSIWLFYALAPAADEESAWALSAENATEKATTTGAEIGSGPDTQAPVIDADATSDAAHKPWVAGDVSIESKSDTTPAARPAPVMEEEVSVKDLSLEEGFGGKDPFHKSPDVANNIKRMLSSQAHTAPVDEGKAKEILAPVIRSDAAAQDEVSIASIVMPVEENKQFPLKPGTIHTEGDDPSVAAGKSGDGQEKAKSPVWRISVSFTPNYVGQSARPIVDDEVFVTAIRDQQQKLSERIGVGFALGTGRTITPDLYLDAQLNFSRTEQSTFYSYATGNVDTLLALQQPDESVRVVPVYEVVERQSASKYTYAGIRFMATYYFLSTPRGRFNIAGGVGINYLLSSTVKEKAGGSWEMLSSDGLNKMNYTFVAGAGYSVRFGTSWELLINPTATYNFRQVKNDQLPYRLNQHPFGLNVMLSRTFGGR